LFASQKQKQQLSSDFSLLSVNSSVSHINAVWVYFKPDLLNVLPELLVVQN
jgi:hypothetical protein